MGKLIDGVWHDVWYETKSHGGQFVRRDSAFRNWVTPFGHPGPSGKGGFKAEPGRYHLYVSLACPWAHRTIIFRKLKELEGVVSMSVVNPLMGPEGWTFEIGEGVDTDEANGATRLHQIYTKADPNFSGRVTVPVLWDKQREVIVSNESSEIVRMFNCAFDHLGAKQVDYYPEAERRLIDALNNFIYTNINNGVYRTGFATTQEAYDEAFTLLFGALDRLEKRLAKNRYLTGQRITEADWRLFTTLIRFDAVYFGHFKCNLRRLQDYPNLSGYTRELYQMPGVAATVDFNHIKAHYYQSHPTINPTGIVPSGPELDLDTEHGR